MIAKITEPDFFVRVKQNQGENFSNYDYSRVAFKSLSNDVEIFCKRCNLWFWQSARYHAAGRGCKKCVDRSRAKSTHQFIREAIFIHGNNIDYSEVEYYNAETKVWLTCLVCNFRFPQTPHCHLSGRGCPGCAGHKDTDLFIQQAKNIHGNKYEYHEVRYVNAETEVSIFCKRCNVFFDQKPHSHLKGCNHFDCSIKDRTKTQELFIKQAKVIHEDRYDYSLVEYKNTQTEVLVICNICKCMFPQKPKIHLMGSGCPDCGKNVLRKSTELFIQQARSVHGSMYDYSFVKYANTKIKVQVVCNRCHKSFNQTPQDHLDGHGCPRCQFTVSDPETKWLDSLNVPQKQRQITLKINGKRFRTDAFDPFTNTIYEFYGDYFHGNPNKFKPNDLNKTVKQTFGSLYQKTLHREKLLKQAGYNIIAIWESDWREQCQKAS